MSHFAEEQLSHLRSLIQARSFGDTTLRFFESLLVSKDVKSLIDIRSSLMQLLRSESLSVIRSIAAKSVHDKLLVLEFFVRAFALVGDLQSCLALRYEALVMRELKSASCQSLQVLPAEWINFVEDALHNGFHAVAEKACESALSCLGDNDVQKPGSDTVSEDLKAIISKITRLRNCAMASVASRSVQVQAADYLKRKTRESDLLNKENRCLASTAFRNGIKRQNMRKLHERQSFHQINDGLVGRHPNLRASCLHPIIFDKLMKTMLYDFTTVDGNYKSEFPSSRLTFFSLSVEAGSTDCKLHFKVDSSNKGFNP